MNNTFTKHQQIGEVSTFMELVNTNFNGAMNAICWNRNLDGDFSEIVSQLQLKDNVTEVSVDDILVLHLSEKGDVARKIILNYAFYNCYDF